MMRVLNVSGCSPFNSSETSFTSWSERQDVLGVEPTLETPKNGFQPWHPKQRSISREVAMGSAGKHGVCSRVITRNDGTFDTTPNSRTLFSNPLPGVSATHATNRPHSLSCPTQLHRHQRLRTKPDWVDKVHHIGLLPSAICRVGESGNSQTA